MSLHGNTNLTNNSLESLINSNLVNTLKTFDIFGCSGITNKSFDDLKKNFKVLENIKYHS